MGETRNSGNAEFGVLLVDDEQQILDGLMRNLRGRNYRVFTANNGADALEVIDRESIDLVVSDQQMPGMSGTRLLTRVRAMWPHIVRIMLTGEVDTRSVKQEVEKGTIYRYLIKPCQPAELKRIVEETLAQLKKRSGNAASLQGSGNVSAHQGSGNVSAQQGSGNVPAQPVPEPPGDFAAACLQPDPAEAMAHLVLTRAAQLGARQVVFQPRAKKIGIQFRRCSVLQTQHEMEPALFPAVAERIEQLLSAAPQEHGRALLHLADSEVLISAFSLDHCAGQLLTLHLTNRQLPNLTLAGLGFGGHTTAELTRIGRHPRGLVLVAGPVESGKSALLYALLGEALGDGKSGLALGPQRVVDLEVPQILLQQQTPQNVATALQHQPDILLVDSLTPETAPLLLQAGRERCLLLTSLLALNTAHVLHRLPTGDPPGTVTHGIVAVVHLRLVRKVCPHCQQPDTPDARAMELLGFDHALLPANVVRGRGCVQCDDTGFLGKTGLCFVDVDRASWPQSAKGFAAGEVTPRLAEDALAKVRAGQTTLQEVLRVLGPVAQTGGGKVI